MATPTTPKKMSDKTKEELRLEAELRAMTEKKKAIFDRTREADEELRQIREAERQKLERLQQIIAERTEKELRERYAACLEAQNRTTQHETGLRTDLEALRSERDRYREQVAALSREKARLQADLQTLQSDNDRSKEQIATLSFEHMNAIEEANVLKRKSSEHHQLLEQLKGNVQRFSSKVNEGNKAHMTYFFF